MAGLERHFVVEAVETVLDLQLGLPGRERSGDLTSRCVIERILPTIRERLAQLAYEERGARAAEAPAAAAAATTLADKVEAQLAGADAPLTAAALRKLCRVRNASLTAALTDLVVAGRARKDAADYVISR